MAYLNFLVSVPERQFRALRRIAMVVSRCAWLLLSCATVLAITGHLPIKAEQVEMPPRKSTPDERNNAFNWFSELAYTDVKDRQFVEVATGRWVTYGNNPTINTFARGFLLEEKGNTFKVLTLSLTELTFEKTPAGTPAWKKVSFDAANLKEGAAAYLKDLRSPRKESDREYHRFGETSLHSRTETFVVAWACWRAGLDDLATELFDHAAKTPTGYGFNPHDLPKEPLQKLVAADLAHTEMWRGVLAFGDPSIPRTQLLKKFEHIVKHLPASDEHKAAKITVDLLTKMIEEDAAHEKSAKKLDQLSKKAQIAELIIQLRDQNGHQIMQPGACDIFDRFGGKDDTAAHKLVKMGYDAVPQLIEHLDDERFTRSVGFHRNFYFSHYVLRVSDCALAILEEIAGMRFWESTSTFSYMSMDKKSGEAKKRAMAWSAEFEKKGEKAFLTEATERGDHNSSEMATRLAKSYPTDALPALMIGARATKMGTIRATLVGLIASFRGDESLEFLLAEIKEGPFAQPRLTAAEELHKRGRPEGLAAMIGWWASRVDLSKGPKERDEDPGEWSWYIIRFLVSSGEMSAIHALAKDLHKQPINSRLGVIAVLGGMDDGPFRGEKKAAKAPKKMAAAVEALLIAALDDRDESSTSKDFPETRVCDSAAQALKRLYPTKYTFDPAAQPSSRNRQLVVMKNVWRTANKLSLLPVPELRRILAVPANELRPILDRYLAATGDSRMAVRKEIERLGLGALPGVLERRDKGGDQNEKAIWNDLAKMLSCIVAEMELAERSVKPVAEVAKRLESLKGKPFDAKMFVETIGFILKNSPKDAQGIRVVVWRAGDGTGFAMKFNFLANPKDVKGPPSQWGFGESVTIGKDRVRSQFGASSDAGLAGWTGSDYPDLEKVLAQVSASNPDQPVEIRIHIVPEWRD